MIAARTVAAPIASLAVALLLVPSPARAQPAAVDTENVARDTVRDLAEGRYDAAAARFSADFRRTMGRDQLALVWDPLRAERGRTRSVHPRLRHDEPDGMVTYTIKCAWAKAGASDVKVLVGKDGLVAGISLADEAPVDDEGARERYENKVALRPPFHGTFVARNAAWNPQNPHYPVRAQRYAVDWVMVEAGKSFRGAGRKNEDYLCWGQPALAPADGTVAIVVDGVPENAPGQSDGYFAPGNFVSIDLGGGEFAMLAHLQPGSIGVKPGDHVKAGQALARIGNSGDSREPHLHFQLCDKARLAECSSLPAKFSGSRLDGLAVPRALPVEGSRLSE